MRKVAEATVVAVEPESQQATREYPVTQPLDWSGVLAKQGYVFGVDISADGERVVLADLRGKVVGMRNSEFGTRNKGNASSSATSHTSFGTPDQVITGATALMRQLLKEKSVKAREVLRIGIGFGGPVDSRLGLVRTAHGAPGWEGFPLAAKIESELDAPSFLENDARLAALGELWFGIGAGEKSVSRASLPSVGDLVYVHWSTGVGGGIVVDGRLLRGASTIAGEIGHTVVRTGDDALPCRCGGRGHLEAYVRGPALLQRANAEWGLPNAEAVSQSQSPVDIPSLFAQAEQDSALRRLVDEAVEMMAVTVGNLITSMNPRVAVIGGRVARDGAHLIPRIAELARGYAMPVSVQDVTIAPAALGDEATVMGAVALALDSLR
jgi:glucokinase